LHLRGGGYNIKAPLTSLEKGKTGVIPHTFIHIPGIGPKTERRLWEEGVTTLEELAFRVESEWESGEAGEEEGKSPAERVRRVIKESVEALEREDWAYFHRVLPQREHWRLLPHFSRPAFLDIETTGLGFSFHHITVIGVYDGRTTYSYVHGRNLEEFPRDLAAFDAVITYSGKTFDLPFILSAFELLPDKPHVDLRYLLASEGLKGGLKNVERLLGMERPEAVRGIDGRTAVLLWEEYVCGGNRKALETLLAYNLEDAVNLHSLAARVYNMKLPEMFSHLALPENPPRPVLPYTPDPLLVSRLAGRRP